MDNPLVNYLWDSFESGEKHMAKKRLLITGVLGVLLLTASVASGRDLDDRENLFSPTMAKQMYELGYELAHTSNITEDEKQQAMLFYTSALYLDDRADYVLPDMIELATQRQREDPNASGLILELLNRYVGDSADLEVVKTAIGYLLNQMDTREKRQELLVRLVNTLGKRNDRLYSDLATHLGLLIAETGDVEQASYYFMKAYEAFQYNVLTFEKLVELMPDNISTAAYLGHQRRMLAMQPYDLDMALSFAMYSENLQLYSVASDAYEYCADVFSYLYPDEQLPSRIYLPWAMSSYNSKSNSYKCLQIAEQIRASGQFNLIVEAIATKAAEKIGDLKQAQEIIASIEQKLASDATKAEPEVAESEIAWFYSFVSQDVVQALNWTNRVYANDTNGVNNAALLGYALVLNDQFELAEALVENYEQNQIANLAHAKIELSKGNTIEAIGSLKETIEKDPGSFAAEKAKHLLEELGSEYIQTEDAGALLIALKNEFGSSVVPEFLKPDEILSVRLSIRGDEFIYGNAFGATLNITNKSSEAIIVSEQGLFTGRIRVDAEVGGDIKSSFVNLISKTIRPTREIGPDETLVVPLKIVTGQLKELMKKHPQADLEIKLTAFIDSLVDEDGRTVNRLFGIEPAVASLTRPKVKITTRFLQNRLNSISEGKSGQKMNAAYLFTGLIAEQQSYFDRRPTYEVRYADWMPALLKSALTKNTADNDWIVSSYTTAEMTGIDLDFELIEAAAGNLNNPSWPVRLITIYLLANNQGQEFSATLNWAAEHDSHKLVKQMAVALGAKSKKMKKLFEMPAEPALSPEDSNISNQ